MSRFILFGTAGCHLCEEAEHLLAHIENITVEQRDIIERTHWLDSYGARIPVLQHQPSQDELDWPFDLNDINQFINNHQPI